MGEFPWNVHGQSIWIRPLRLSSSPITGVLGNIATPLLSSGTEEVTMQAKNTQDGRLNVRLPKDLLKRLKVECTKRDTTLQRVTQVALEAWIRLRT